MPCKFRKVLRKGYSKSKAAKHQHGNGVQSTTEVSVESGIHSSMVASTQANLSAIHTNESSTQTDSSAIHTNESSTQTDSSAIHTNESSTQTGSKRKSYDMESMDLDRPLKKRRRRHVSS